MAFSIAHPVSTRDSHIIPRTGGPRGRGLIQDVVWTNTYYILFIYLKQNLLTSDNKNLQHNTLQMKIDKFTIIKN